MRPFRPTFFFLLLVLGSGPVQSAETLDRIEEEMRAWAAFDPELEVPLAIAGLKAAGISEQAGRSILTRLMLSDSGPSQYRFGQLRPEAVSKVKLITARFAARKRGILRQGGMGELPAGEESRLLRELRQEEIAQIGESLSAAERDEFDLWNGTTAKRIERYLDGIALPEPRLRALLDANRVFDHAHRPRFLKTGTNTISISAPNPSEYLQARQALFDLRERECAILGIEDFVRYLARIDRPFEDLVAKTATHRSLTASQARQLWQVFALFELRTLAAGLDPSPDPTPTADALAAALQEEITLLFGPDTAAFLNAEIEQRARRVHRRLLDYPVIALPSS